MAVRSAEDLHGLISTLGMQFGNHRDEANELWNSADNHIAHVVQEGGSWISHEIQNLENDWHVHRQAIQNAEQWFSHHAPLLSAFSADPLNLAATVFAVGASAGLKGTHIGNIWGPIRRRLPITGELDGTPDLPGKWKLLFSASGEKTLSGKLGKAIEDDLNHSKSDLTDMLKKHGLSEVAGKADSVAGKVHGVMSGAGNLFTAIGITSDLRDVRTDVGQGHYGEAISQGLDAVATGLKGTKDNPLAYVVGVNVDVWTDVVKAGSHIDWNPGSLLSAFAPSNVISKDGVQAIEGAGKTWAGEAWAAVS